ncbi:MAG: dinitrogenase iron-molybdenum cofactor biosynthesis protein [Deltaproteobacteria bacterium]|nr:dinitrogenase iron-molybdenum cofactor biosynthesis protein [Deltaproteobacteria bacterium]
MQIAIVSTDGVNVNDHFGKAERFLIYEAGPQGLAPIAERQVARLSTGDQSHQFDAARFAAVAEALAGCQRVYCTRIGDRPRQELEKLGITAVIHEGAIAAISAA